jgi:4-hydroxymandelate oxidase
VRDPLDPLDLDALEAAARERLDRGVYDYVAGGADDEHSVADAQAAWARMALRPRVLRDVSQISMAATVLGVELPVPLLVAPMAYHRMAHPDGETASAAGAAAAGAGYILSTQATMTVEEVAEAAPAGLRWFQVYVVRDRGWTCPCSATGSATCATTSGCPPG